jgi:uncharacterized protein YkwD
LVVWLLAMPAAAYAAAPHAVMTAGPEPETRAASATLTFRPSGGGLLQGFECAVDGAGWRPCTSPLRLDGLGGGPHTVLVRLTGLLADSSPARWAWTVLHETVVLAPASPVLPAPPEPAGEKPVCAAAAAHAGTLSPGRLAAATRCLVNVARTAGGLPTLHPDWRLAAAAAAHAQDMVARRYFGHVSPDGGTLRQRARATGYLRTSDRAWSLGEAMAWRTAGVATPVDAVRALLASPPHRRVLLGAAYRDAGVAVVPHAPAGGGSTGATWVIDVGRRR